MIRRKGPLGKTPSRIECCGAGSCAMVERIHRAPLWDAADALRKSSAQLPGKT